MPRLAGAHQLGDGRFVCNRSSNPVGVGVETLLRHGCVRTCVELTPHTPGRAPCSMVALFDNEEVGSSSMMGAASSMMSEVCLCYVLPAISLRAHAHTLLGAGHCPHLYHRLLGVVGHQEEHAGAAPFSFLNAPARYSRARVCVCTCGSVTPGVGGYGARDSPELPGEARGQASPGAAQGCRDQEQRQPTVLWFGGGCCVRAADMLTLFACTSATRPPPCRPSC